MTNMTDTYMGSVALADILKERQRQVSVEGFTLAHDDKHNTGDLAIAAAAYLVNWSAYLQVAGEYGFDEQEAAEALAEVSPPAFWPWEPEWWKPHNDRSDLVRAGALILAEIERIDRAEVKQA